MPDSKRLLYGTVLARSPNFSPLTSGYSTFTEGQGQPAMRIRQHSYTIANSGLVHSILFHYCFHLNKCRRATTAFKTFPYCATFFFISSYANRFCTGDVSLLKQNTLACAKQFKSSINGLECIQTNEYFQSKLSALLS
jgi:hypothetical protein